MDLVVNDPYKPIVKTDQYQDKNIVLKPKHINMFMASPFLNGNFGVGSYIFSHLKIKNKILSKLRPQINSLTYNSFYNAYVLKIFSYIMQYISIKVRLNSISPCQTKLIMDDGLHLLLINIKTKEATAIHQSEDISQVFWSNDGSKFGIFFLIW